MNLTRDEEKIFLWAEKEQNQQITNNFFSSFDVSTESYYEKCKEEDSLVYEYAFETLPELKGQLTEMWGKNKFMHEMILISSVSAMKYKSEKNRTTGSLDNNNLIREELEIPEYVYVF